MSVYVYMCSVCKLSLVKFGDINIYMVCIYMCLYVCVYLCDFKGERKREISMSNRIL